MILIGIAGRAGAGKDTIADYLVASNGFIKFSFSDALYLEVQTAFDLPDQKLLRDRETKDTPTLQLALHQCEDKDFIDVVLAAMWKDAHYASRPATELRHVPLSPRYVLQLWGTEYRRVKQPDYWLERAGLWMKDQYNKGHTRFVNTSVRFKNEREWIYHGGGTVWHVLRNDLPPMDNAGHESEKPLPIRIGDYVIHNVGTLRNLELRVFWALDAMLRRVA